MLQSALLNMQTKEDGYGNGQRSRSKTPTGDVAEPLEEAVDEADVKMIDIIEEENTEPETHLPH
jgi:hypothetical protein